MEFNDLTDEQKAKVRACKTADELIALAKAKGVVPHCYQLPEL